MDKNSLATARTRGDGMENIDAQQMDPKLCGKTILARKCESDKLNASTSKPTIPGAFSIYRSTDDDSASVKLPAKVPQGKLFYLVPHLVNSKKSFSLKNKEPKFVPFEPYKAAVSEHQLRNGPFAKQLYSIIFSCDIHLGKSHGTDEAFTQDTNES